MRKIRPKGIMADARKDKDIKICTSKGVIRDRRIRLSANTAIQFYDLQDRLGFDRPTNAIDWLIKEAKAAIDVLNDDHYHHLLLHELLQPEAFGGWNYNQQNLYHDQTNGLSKYAFETLNSKDNCQSQQGNPMPLHLNQKPEDEGFEFVNRESNFHPSIVYTQNNEFSNEDDRFFGAIDSSSTRGASSG